MSTSAISSTTNIAQTQATKVPLTKDSDGDYKPATIAANPGSAAGMVKTADGDYAPSGSAAAVSTGAVQAALSNLKTGG
jgi:hypothetical protein